MKFSIRNWAKFSIHVEESEPIVSEIVSQNELVKHGEAVMRRKQD